MWDVLAMQERTRWQGGRGRDTRTGKPSWEVLSSSLTGRSNCQHQTDLIVSIHWIIEKARELQKNIYLCFIDYDKALDCVDHNKLWKILKEMGIPIHLTCLLRNLYTDQEATEPDMKQQTGSNLGKEYIKAVYCHPAYFTYMQSTSYEMPGWMKHKLESRLPEKYQ